MAGEFAAIKHQTVLNDYNISKTNISQDQKQ